MFPQYAVQPAQSPPLREGQPLPSFGFVASAVLPAPSRLNPGHGGCNPTRLSYAEDVALQLTVTFVASGRPDIPALEQLSDGRFRDANGNAYSPVELTDSASSSGSFAVSLEESEIAGWTVAEALEAVGDIADALVRAYLTTDHDTVYMGGLTLSLPQDSERETFTLAGEINPLVGTDEHVPTYKPVIAVSDIAASVSSEADPHTVVHAEDSSEE